MSHPDHVTGAATRRARRAAERHANKADRRAARPSTRTSPILIITAVVGGLGVVLLGGLILFGGAAGAPGSPGDTGGSGSGALIAPSPATPTALADGRSLGASDAPVTLEIWSDFQCPVCGVFARTVEPALEATYVTAGTLRIVQHDAAFQGARAGGSYDESVESAAGARCAADQAAYWPFSDWTFANQSGENQGAFAAARLRRIASAAGLDLAAWDACLATGEAQTAVRKETQQAVGQGINATPTMTLNGEVIVGLRSVADLSALIDAAAAATGG